LREGEWKMMEVDDLKHSRIIHRNGMCARFGRVLFGTGLCE
jgi:hypothetical protein